MSKHVFALALVYMVKQHDFSDGMRNVKGVICVASYSYAYPFVKAKKYRYLIVCLDIPSKIHN